MTAPDGGRRPGRGHAAPAVDASMSLLYEVMYRPVDPGYAEAARRGPETLAPPARARRTVVNLLIAVLLGLITVSAITVLRTPRPDALEGRALLREQIDERSTAVASSSQTDSTTEFMSNDGASSPRMAARASS